MKIVWPVVTLLRAIRPFVVVAATAWLFVACEDRDGSLGPGTIYDATYLIQIGGSGEDLAGAILMAPDGGHFVVGWTDSFGSGSGDVLVVKLDPGGGTSWKKTYGQSGFDVGEAATLTSDGGLLVAGWTRPVGRQDTDILLLRLDSRGKLLWERSFVREGRELGFAVAATGNGSFIIAGIIDSTSGANSDVLLMKVDAAGNLLWRKNYGGDANDGAFSIAKIPGVGFGVAGFSESFGSGSESFGSGSESFGSGARDAYVIAVDEAGDFLWQQTTGCAGRCEARSVTVTPDGALVICGTRDKGTAGLVETFLHKFDQSGGERWQTSIGGDGVISGESVLSMSDGSLVVAGYTNISSRGIWDAFILKTDESGNWLWQNNFGGASADFGWTVSAAENGGFAVAGWTKSFGAELHDIMVVRTDSLGQVADSALNSRLSHQSKAKDYEED